MIITCPECATRYDLEDDRFLPNGRSVRCTACGESWFVPAPEPIEALSMERAVRPPRDERDAYGADSDARSRGEERRDHARDQKKTSSRLNIRIEDADGEEKPDLLPPRDEKGRFLSRSAYGKGEDDCDQRRSEPRFDDAMDREDFDDDNDSLFESPVSRVKRTNKEESRRDSRDDDRLNDREQARFRDRSEPRNNSAREEDEDVPPKGWRKGKQFYVEDDGEEEDRSPRSFFSRGKKPKADREEEDRSFFRSKKRDKNDDKDHERDGLRFGDMDGFEDDYEQYETARTRRASGRRPTRESSYDDYDEDENRYADNYDTEEDDIVPGEATIVDADWEDVEDIRNDSLYPGRGFGKRVREERRRSTAVARMEDVRRFEPAMFDEEFFASLRVTPRELERAVTKARRRAESREKNRMTPWRAFGWSAWVAAIAGAAYAVVAYRDEIVKVAPSAAEAYAVVGIETDQTGLKIEDVRHRLAMSTGGPMIEITGALRNQGSDALDAPLLQAEALGPRGELLARWTFTPAEPTVSGNDAVEFVTRNLAPEGVSEVALSFAPAQSALGVPDSDT